jgi:fructose-bisphosphate aldolase class II
MQTRTVTPLPASVKPGVVTGQALSDLLAHAKENGYAIPAVNTVTSSSVNACLEAAKKFGSPMIIQFSRGGGQFYAGKAADNTDDAACIAGTIAVRAQPRGLHATFTFTTHCECSRAWLSCLVMLPPSPPCAGRAPRA